MLEGWPMQSCSSLLPFSELIPVQPSPILRWRTKTKHVKDTWICTTAQRGSLLFSVSSLVILNIWFAFFNCYWTLNCYLNETIYRDSKTMLVSVLIIPIFFDVELGFCLPPHIYLYWISPVISIAFRIVVLLIILQGKSFLPWIITTIISTVTSVLINFSIFFMTCWVAQAAVGFPL